MSPSLNGLQNQPPNDLFSIEVARGEKDLEREQAARAIQFRTESDCLFCEKSVIHADESTYFEVTTWVRGSSRDSAILRDYSGRVAHRECVKGISKRRIEAYNASLVREQVEVSALREDREIPEQATLFDSLKTNIPDNQAR